MKAVIVLMLLIATVYCLPVKRSASSSESSEEHVVVQRPAPIPQKPALKLVQVEPSQSTTTDSDESTDSADDTEDADEESETDDKDEEIDTDSSESESKEIETTSVPTTLEPTLDPIINTGRGDSLGYPNDYKKSIVYVDAKDIEKIPSPYKSYSSEKLGDLIVIRKKMSAYDDQRVNDVEKEIKLFKTLQVHEEEDSSTPEMDNTVRGTEEDMGNHEIASAGNQVNEEGVNTSVSTSDSASASQEETEESEGSLSSEETTTTPGSADSEEDSSQSTESQESNSDEETTQTTEVTVVIAK
ncbi:dentin sialophosphoprotein-like [Xyrauchen texanus]|uniref:dentin sialophosphoprotein-like n=1 Tax=Xyrauchen texanus TaxID=154827 RepID=UPI002242C2BC|nr:dentin sialophosphoprotein-like [Xyrauchen texanus]